MTTPNPNVGIDQGAEIINDAANIRAEEVALPGELATSVDFTRARAGQAALALGSAGDRYDITKIPRPNPEDILKTALADAGNPDLTEGIQLQLATTTNQSPEVLVKLAQNVGIAPAVANHLAQSRNPNVIYALALNTGTPAELLGGFWAKRDMIVVADGKDRSRARFVAAIARRRDIAPEVLTQIAGAIREFHSYYSGPDHEDKLIPATDVGAALVYHPSISREALASLYHTCLGKFNLLIDQRLGRITGR